MKRYMIYTDCNPVDGELHIDEYEQGDWVKYEDVKARIAELEAKIERLESRGISDMQHRIAALKGALKDAVAEMNRRDEINKHLMGILEALRGE